MEKPIARTEDEARSMIAAARKAGVKLMVAENYRFLPAVERCKRMMQQGAIGYLRLIQAQVEGYSMPTEWRTSADLVGGGVFIDSGIHFVDVMVHLGGFPRRVYALRPPQVFRNTEGEDGLVVTAHLPDGALGLINFSRATPVGGSTQSISITGSDGQITFAPYGRELMLEARQVRRTVRLSEARRGVRGMVQEFRSSIAEEREPAMSGEEGLRDLMVVLAAYESAAQGREVTLAE